jgi:SAM-dependent methyltransferase
MRYEAEWRPSKYVLRRGRLRASSDTRMVAAGSWLIADLVAECYWSARSWLRPGRVLDLGCGSVPLYEVYRPIATSIVCLDWPGTLHERKHVDCFTDLNRGVPVADRSCDTALLSDVLEHVYDHRLVLEEIARVLKPDGVLVMNTPFLYRIHEAPHDYFRYTEFALRRMLETAGFHVAELRPVGGILEVVGDLLGKVTARIPVIGGFVATQVQRTIRFAAGSRLLGRSMVRSGTVFPLGYFIVASRSVGEQK